jgi:hypothetical protein
VIDVNQSLQTHANNLPNSIFNLAKKDPITRCPLTQKSNTNNIIAVEGDVLQIEEILDMSRTTTIEGQLYHIVNKCKFGTLWWLKSTTLEYESI